MSRKARLRRSRMWWYFIDHNPNGDASSNDGSILLENGTDYLLTESSDVFITE